MRTSRLLLVVALVSAVISAGCLGGAYSLVNANDSGSTEVISRESPWDGSTSLALDVAGVVRYVQGSGPGKVIARGPHRSVSTLMVSNGHVHDQLVHTGAVLEIEITAPAVTKFYLNSRSRLSIETYDQETLALVTDGSAVIDVAGRVRNATLTMQGASSIDLSRLDAETVSGVVGGASTLVTAPLERADLLVKNFATTVLLRRPINLVTKLENSGRVINAMPASQQVRN